MGARSNPSPRRGEESATRKLLDHLRWIDVTVALADRAGELARKHMRSHPAINTVDYLIAAATESVGAQLKTQDVKHFSMIVGLTPAYRP